MVDFFLNLPLNQNLSQHQIHKLRPFTQENFIEHSYSLKSIIFSVKFDTKKIEKTETLNDKNVCQ